MWLLPDKRFSDPEVLEGIGGERGLVGRRWNRAFPLRTKYIACSSTECINKRAKKGKNQSCCKTSLIYLVYRKKGPMCVL